MLVIPRIMGHNVTPTNYYTMHPGISTKYTSFYKPTILPIPKPTITSTKHIPTITHDAHVPTITSDTVSEDNGPGWNYWPYAVVIIAIFLIIKVKEI
jgi:hypothetical protein